jgi:hypothetical protein
MQYGVFEHCMNVASVYNDCFALHRSLSLTARCWPFRLHAAWLDTSSDAMLYATYLLRTHLYICIWWESYIKLRRLARPPSRRRGTCGGAFNETSKHTTYGTFRIQFFGFCQVANPGRVRPLRKVLPPQMDGQDDVRKCSLPNSNVQKITTHSRASSFIETERYQQCHRNIRSPGPFIFCSS